MSLSKKTIDLYWYNKEYNFGDQVNPYLIPKLFGVNVKWIDPSKNIKKYFAIGSILAKATSQTIVWGSGLISDSVRLTGRPIILSVRGPLTRSRLRVMGLSVPEVYGDPALLLPTVYSPKVDKKFKLGIIPHYVDKNSNFIKSMKNRPSTKIIDVQERNIETTIKDMLSCDLVISSSLHGIIVADAYGIPNIWVKISDGIVGGNFKFNDYFSSVNRSKKVPVIANSELNIDRLVSSYTPEIAKIDLAPLLKSQPFI